MAAAAIELSDMGSSGASKSAPASKSAGLSQADKAALEPLETEIQMLGVNRHNLEQLQRIHSRRYGGRLHDMYFKRGSAKHHNNMATKVVKTPGSHLQDLPLDEIAAAHTAIANRIETIKLSIEEGAFKMLSSGKWDATSQLLDAGEQINNTVKNLPYLNNFK